MAREDPQFRIRMPAELKEIVEESAQKAGRSLNAEIVHRVAESFRMTEGHGRDSSNEISYDDLQAFAQKNFNRLEYIDRLSSEFAKQLANRNAPDMDLADELRPLLLNRLNQFEDERQKIISTLKKMGLEKELLNWQYDNYHVGRIK